MLIGITGGFACGKSALLRIFARRGFGAFDSDRFVASLYREKRFVKKICRIFPATLKNDRVNKRLLAKTVFSDRKKLARLNSIVHPLVKKEIGKIRHAGRIVFVEVPLLFEAKMRGLFDMVILVRCRKKTALRRAVKAGFAKSDFFRRRSFQWPDRKKATLSDFVLDSSRGMKVLRRGAQGITKELADIQNGKTAKRRQEMDLSG